MAEIETPAGIVVGVFQDPSNAQQAIRELMDCGFTEDQIGVVLHDDRIDGNEQERRVSDVQDGAAAGAAAGLGVGTLWGLIS